MELGNIIVGDTLDFTVGVPNRSADEGWTLKYRLIPRVSGTAISFSSTADGSLHNVNVPAATTAEWEAGTYSWLSYVENVGGDSFSLLTGSVTLLPDPRVTDAPLDLRSAAQVALDQAESAMAAWTPTTRRYRIGDREMEFSSREDIVPVIDYWKLKVQREQRAARKAAGLPDPRKTFVRLGRV